MSNRCFRFIQEAPPNFITVLHDAPHKLYLCGKKCCSNTTTKKEVHEPYQPWHMGAPCILFDSLALMLNESCPRKGFSTTCLVIKYCFGWLYVTVAAAARRKRNLPTALIIQIIFILLLSLPVGSAWMQYHQPCWSKTEDKCKTLVELTLVIGRNPYLWL